MPVQPRLGVSICDHISGEGRPTRRAQLPINENLNLNPSFIKPTTTAPPPRLKHLGIYGICYNGTLWDILSHIAAHSLESLQVNAIIDSAFQVSPTLRDKLSRLTGLHITNRRPKHDPYFQCF
jgi:hypothetical protein